MNTMKVTFDHGRVFKAHVRGHEIAVDQPLDNHGEDTAPTPTELLVAALGTCVGLYANSFLRRHEVDSSGFSLEVHWEKATDPDRIGAFNIRLHIPAGVPEKLRAPLLRVAKSCYVHHTMANHPAVEVELVDTPEVARA
jgi:putative redox protein